MKQVNYKGRTYNLVWEGNTKYGPRCKLAFTNDPSKEFWVAQNVVTAVRSTSYSRGSRRGCKGCGGQVVDARHHRAMDGYCGSCAFDEFDC